MYVRKTPQNSYPWEIWSDGRVWILRKDVHYTSSAQNLIANAKVYAQTYGLKCECSTRNKCVTLRFFKPVR